MESWQIAQQAHQQAHRNAVDHWAFQDQMRKRRRAGPPASLGRRLAGFVVGLVVVLVVLVVAATVMFGNALESMDFTVDPSGGGGSEQPAP